MALTFSHTSPFTLPVPPLSWHICSMILLCHYPALAILYPCRYCSQRWPSRDHTKSFSFPYKSGFPGVVLPCFCYGCDSHYYLLSFLCACHKFIPKCAHGALRISLSRPKSINYLSQRHPSWSPPSCNANLYCVLSRSAKRLSFRNLVHHLPGNSLQLSPALDPLFPIFYEFLFLLSPFQCGRTQTKNDYHGI